VERREEGRCLNEGIKVLFVELCTAREGMEDEDLKGQGAPPSSSHAGMEIPDFVAGQAPPKRIPRRMEGRTFSMSSSSGDSEDDSGDDDEVKQEYRKRRAHKRAHTQHLPPLPLGTLRDWLWD